MQSIRRLTQAACTRLLLGLLLVIAVANAAGAQTTRILLVGDSWAQQAWSARAFQTALQNKGLGQFEELGGTTTIGGTTAAQWATGPYLDLITAALLAHPSIDIVHLSIGGNDFLGAPAGSDPLVIGAQILADTQTVVDHILDIRPNAFVAHASYDYIPAGFNTEAALITQLLIDQAAQTRRSYVVNDLGVLHHVFGYPPYFGPGETPLPGGFPDFVPLQGGDPAYTGDPAIFDDAIHPSDAGYVALAEHAIDAYYATWLLQGVPVPGLGALGTSLLAALLGLGGVWRAVRR